MNDNKRKIDDILNTIPPHKIRGFEIVKNEYRKHYNFDVVLPLRGTSNSAGYDFYSNENVTIKPGEKHLFWTDIKAYMMPREVLEIYVRSSIAIKKNLILCNLVGIIDMDYFSNESNDGNIGVCLQNNGKYDIDIVEGERIAQGIFKIFLESDNCNSNETRIGGIGHTNK
jgi:dUTP pyrophosphatase